MKVRLKTVLITAGMFLPNLVSKQIRRRRLDGPSGGSVVMVVVVVVVVVMVEVVVVFVATFHFLPCEKELIGNRDF